jgi:hypothetical protein
MRPYALLRGLLAGILMALSLCTLPALAADPPPENDGARVLQSFQGAAAAPAQPDSTDLSRRWIMFGLGLPLLLLLLATAALGVAMGVYGKPVFVAHMVCAGLTVTLAVVHVIVGLVWFRPF